MINDIYKYIDIYVNHIKIYISHIIFDTKLSKNNKYKYVIKIIHDYINIKILLYNFIILYDISDKYIYDNVINNYIIMKIYRYIKNKKYIINEKYIVNNIINDNNIIYDIYNDVNNIMVYINNKYRKSYNIDLHINLDKYKKIVNRHYFNNIKFRINKNIKNKNDKKVNFDINLLYKKYYYNNDISYISKISKNIKLSYYDEHSMNDIIGTRANDILINRYKKYKNHNYHYDKNGIDKLISKYIYNDTYNNLYKLLYNIYKINIDICDIVIIILNNIIINKKYNYINKHKLTYNKSYRYIYDNTKYINNIYINIIYRIKLNIHLYQYRYNKMIISLDIIYLIINSIMNNNKFIYQNDILKISNFKKYKIRNKNYTHDINNIYIYLYINIICNLSISGVADIESIHNIQYLYYLFNIFDMSQYDDRKSDNNLSSNKKCYIHNTDIYRYLNNIDQINYILYNYIIYIISYDIDIYKYIYINNNIYNNNIYHSLSNKNVKMKLSKLPKIKVKNNDINKSKRISIKNLYKIENENQIQNNNQVANDNNNNNNENKDQLGYENNNNDNEYKTKYNNKYNDNEYKTKYNNKYNKFYDIYIIDKILHNMNHNKQIFNKIIYNYIYKMDILHNKYNQHNEYENYNQHNEYGNYNTYNKYKTNIYNNISINLDKYIHICDVYNYIYNNILYVVIDNLDLYNYLSEFCYISINKYHVYIHNYNYNLYINVFNKSVLIFTDYLLYNDIYHYFITSPRIYKLDVLKSFFDNFINKKICIFNTITSYDIYHCIDNFIFEIYK